MVLLEFCIYCMYVPSLHRESLITAPTGASSYLIVSVSILL